MLTAVLASVLVAGLLALAACGNQKDTEIAAGNQSPQDQTNANPNAQEQDMTAKPTVSLPEGPLPTTLVSTDLVVGTGAEAAPGQQVSVHYVGVHTDGSQFDASWDSGQPLVFPLGAGRVIAGWDQGVAGMKVGGRRQLVIPADLAYGASGYPPVIKPNETLVFVVDLISVG